MSRPSVPAFVFAFLLLFLFLVQNFQDADDGGNVNLDPILKNLESATGLNYDAQ